MKAGTITNRELQVAARLVRSSMLEAVDSHQEYPISTELEAKLSVLSRKADRVQKLHMIRQRAASFLIAVFLGTLSWLAFDTQARASVLAWIRSVYESSIVYEFFEGYQTEQALPNYELGNLPDGMVLVEEAKGNDLCHSKFYLNVTTKDSLLLQYSRSSDELVVQMIEPHAPIQNTAVCINNQQIDLCYSISTGIVNASWYDDEAKLFFSVDSNLEEAVVIDIIRSMYAVSPKNKY